MVTGLVCIWSAVLHIDFYKRLDFGGGGEGKEGEAQRWEKWEKEAVTGKRVKSKVLTHQRKHFYIFLFVTHKHAHSVSLPAPQLWEFHGISVIACLYLRNALSGLRALLISGGLDWLLSAEHTQ